MEKAYPVIIEPLNYQHLEQVILLLQNVSTYLPPVRCHNEIWTAFQSQSNVHSVVAIKGDIVIGYGSIIIELKIRGGKMGHIEDIVSHPNQRNKGIGKMIVSALYDIARSKSCYKVSLQCQQHNISFYEKCDFKLSGTTMQRFIE
ncbi:GNAT family N-acetyltransferase [Alcaligenaceae bacterium LF4-65]|uniref:GNAT family N-acetyltransferase n=1 Tax=Zwartia hollandica TaxID=324606 RepID=A0A953N738_9BURK|nr:GNAT family N-acetyltransferase [Zwartia hollandica]MBZ1350126.1 GNAT family N-acetyltransferase [Zwartia hollandica]